MHHQDTVKLLSTLRIRYPTAKLWEQEASATGKAWAMTLADIDYAAAECVLVDWCRREVWPPDPAEIRQRVRTRQRDEQSARDSAALIEGYRLPALGDGWMGRAGQSSRSNEEATEQVMELAAAWERGEIGLDSIRRQCSGYDRFIAMNHARDQVRDLVAALADEDDRRAGSVVTKHGAFTPQDLREHGGIAATVNGQRVVQWPTSGRGGRWRYGETQ
jgi:hypothetical protein